MPKKVKKGGKKVMTREEMALNLQQKAQAQEEMERRKEQTVTQFLKDKLKEDENSTAVWLPKLNATWKTLFHLCKNKEQRELVDVLKQTCERQLDGIDSCIKDMVDELMEKERHSAEVHQCHLMHISRLCELQKKRTAFLQQEWESSMDKIKKCYKLRREQMLAEDKLPFLSLEDTAPAVQDQYEDLLKETVSSFHRSMEFMEKSFQENRKKLVCKCRGQLKEHQNVLEQRQQELEEVTSKNQRCREALKRAMKDLESDEKKLMKLQAKQASNEVSESHVREQLEVAQDQNKKLRIKIKRSCTKARKHLTELTVQSNAAAKNLKSVIAQGERVLRMATLCKKMEDRLFMTEQNLDTEVREELAEKFEIPELRLLTRLHNVTREQHHALRQQRNALLCQNEQLKRQKEDMRHHWDNMEVRGGAGLTQGHKPTAQGSSKVTTPLSGDAPGRGSPEYHHSDEREHTWTQLSS